MYPVFKFPKMEHRSLAPALFLAYAILRFCPGRDSVSFLVMSSLRTRSVVPLSLFPYASTPAQRFPLPLCHLREPSLVGTALTPALRSNPSPFHLLASSPSLHLATTAKLLLRSSPPLSSVQPPSSALIQVSTTFAKIAPATVSSFLSTICSPPAYRNLATLEVLWGATLTAFSACHASTQTHKTSFEDRHQSLQCLKSYRHSFAPSYICYQSNPRQNAPGDDSETSVRTARTPNSVSRKIWQIRLVFCRFLAMVSCQLLSPGQWELLHKARKNVQ